MVDEKIPPPQTSAPKQPKTFTRDKKEIKLSNEELISLGDAQSNQDLFAKNVGLVGQLAARLQISVS